MGYRYSLAYVTVTLSRNNTEVARFGGQGAMIGSISVERSNDRFSLDADATGGVVVNETLDKSGTVTINIKQFASLVSTLTNLFNKYDTNDSSGYGPNSSNGGALDIVISYNSKLVAQAKGCFLNMPELTFEEESGDRDFSFISCEVDYEINGVNGIKFN